MAATRRSSVEHTRLAENSERYQAEGLDPGADGKRARPAVDQHYDISTDEFRTLNRCLDNAIADAVTAFGAARQLSIDAHAATLQERLVAFADAQRLLVDIAIQAYSAIKTGNVGLTGATGTLLIHALDELRSLPERVLPEIHSESPLVAVEPAKLATVA